MGLGGEAVLIMTLIAGGELELSRPRVEEEEVRRCRGGELMGLLFIWTGGEEGEEEGRRGCVRGEAGEERRAFPGLLEERRGLEEARVRGGGERRGEGLEVVGWRDFSEGGLGEQSGEEKLPPEEIVC